MAAADYYNPSSLGPGPGVPQGPPPPNQNLRPPNMNQAPAVQSPSVSGSSLPYPLSDAPPPYSAFTDQQRPSSQPPPQQRPQPPFNNPQTNGGAQYQPYHPPGQQNGDTHQYPPEKLPQRPSLQNTYRPSDYTSQYPPAPLPQQQQQYQPPIQQQQGQQQPNGYTRPGLSQIYGKEVRFNNRPASQPAPSYPSSSPDRKTRYRSPSRSRSRSRSRDRERRRHHNNHKSSHTSSRDQSGGKKASSTSTFLGAGGGALLGDMIFPGLGTIGGAILGGVGGHEYSKDKKSRKGGYDQKRSYSHGETRGDYYEDEYRREEDYRRGRR